MSFASMMVPGRPLAVLAAVVGLWVAPHPAFADLAIVEPGTPVEDVTGAFSSIETPQAKDESGLIDPPSPRVLPNDNPFAGWSAITLENPSAEPLERILVFSSPALGRSGLFGAALGSPQVVAVRHTEGASAENVPLVRTANRFAGLSVTLEPGSRETFALEFKGGSRATSVHAWDPAALARFDTFLLLGIGLFLGISFVGAALLFALRVLSGGPGLLSGALLALAALLFESASFGFGSGIGQALGAIGLGGGGLRSIGLILVCFFGLEFLRGLLVLREEAPLVDLGLRVIQYACLVAIPLLFVGTLGPASSRVAATVALIVAGLTVWNTRTILPDALQLLPPGLAMIALGGIGALVVSGLGLQAGGVAVELLLHGLFVIGTMLLVFSGAVRATLAPAVVDTAGPVHVPTFARVAEPAPPPLPAVLPKRTAEPAPQQGLWDWRVPEDRLYVSPSVEAMMGLGEGALAGKERQWFARIAEADRAVYRDTLAHYVRQGNSSFVVEFRVHHQDGGLRWLQLRVTGLAGETGGAARLIGVVTDITSAKSAEEQLVREASHDALTGVGNRALLVSHLDWALASHREHPVVDQATETVLAPALIVLGIDGMKELADELGPGAADQLTVQMARRIEKSVGPDDVIARTGREEFAVLIVPARQGESNQGTMVDPADVAELLSDTATQPLDIAGRDLKPSITLACVRLGEHHATAQDVLAEAQDLLSGSKRRIAGLAEFRSLVRVDRGAPALPPPEPPNPLESDLRSAIQRGQMKVLYQPIMTLSDKSVAGFEALLRWDHPQRGLLPPGEFIPIAERSGLIVTLGRFALSMAALQLAQWQAFFPLRRPLFATVNVSSRQLLGEGFVRDVSDVLEAVTLAPSTLKLEVTESLVFDDDMRVANMLQKITAQGVSIALDDYGTGHSNLSRLKNLPLSTVKIDKEFVTAAGDGKHGDTILRSTIALAHEMRLEVVAEGVESQSQMNALSKLGCDLAQGYLFGGPMTAPEAQRFIAMNWRIEPRNARQASA